jgi:hypothetical protein
MEEPEAAWPPLVSSSIFTYHESQLMSEDQYIQTLQVNQHLVPRPDLISQFGNSRIPYLQAPKTFYFVDRIEERTLYGKVLNIISKNKKQMPFIIEERKETQNIKPDLKSSENAEEDEIMIINPPIYCSQQSQRAEKGYVASIIEEPKKVHEEVKESLIEHSVKEEIMKPEVEREKSKTELEPKLASNQNVCKPNNTSNKDIASSHADYIIDSKIQSITHPCDSSKKKKMVACKCIMF